MYENYLLEVNKLGKLKITFLKWIENTYFKFESFNKLC